MSLPSIFDYLPEEAPVLMKTAMSPALMQGLQQTAKGSAGAALKGQLTNVGTPVLKSTVGRLQSMARKGVGGLEIAAPKPAVNLAAHGLSGIDPFAKAAAEQKKEPSIPYSPAVLKSAIKTTIPYVIGVPIGTALGRGIGMGIEALEKHRGAPLVSRDKVLKYGPMAFMALGGLLAAREAAHRRMEREIWRSADKSSQNGATGSAS